jgi:hypothetical protein
VGEDRRIAHSMAPPLATRAPSPVRFSCKSTYLPRYYVVRTMLCMYGVVRSSQPYLPRPKLHFAPPLAGGGCTDHSLWLVWRASVGRLVCMKQRVVCFAMSATYLRRSLRTKYYDSGESPPTSYACEARLLRATQVSTVPRFG